MSVPHIFILVRFSHWQKKLETEDKTALSIIKPYSVIVCELSIQWKIYRYTNVGDKKSSPHALENGGRVSQHVAAT